MPRCWRGGRSWKQNMKNISTLAVIASLLHDSSQIQTKRRTLNPFDFAPSLASLWPGRPPRGWRALRRRTASREIDRRRRRNAR